MSKGRGCQNDIDGVWQASALTAAIPVVPPATEILITEAAAGSEADMARAASSAGKAFDRWSPHRLLPCRADRTPKPLGEPNV